MAQQVGLRGAPIRVALRRGLVLTCVLVVIGVAAGATYGWYQERYAVARATILVNPLDGNPFSTSARGDNLANMETEAQLVGSQDVLERVVQSTDGDRSTDDLIAGLDVAVPTNTQLIEIRFRSVNPAESVQIAQSFATSFLALREERSRSLIESQVGSIQNQLTQRKAERDQLEKRLARAKGGEAISLRAQIASINNQLDSLRSRIVELQIGPFNPGMIVTPAALDHDRALDAWLTFGAVGFVSGLLLSLIVALIRARLDSRIHSIEDVELSGRTILAQIARAEADEAVTELERVGSASHLSVSPGLQELRVSVLTADHRRPLVVLLASGSDDGDLAPVTVAGLSLSMVSAGLRTVVVDTTGTCPRPSAQSGMPSLVEVLSGEGEFSSSDSMLSVLSAGRPSEAEDLLMAPTMAQLVRTLKKHADVVIIATGGVRHYRARALGECVDGVLTEIVEGVSNQADTRLGSSALEVKDYGLVYVAASPSTGGPAAQLAKADDEIGAAMATEGDRIGSADHSRTLTTASGLEDASDTPDADGDVVVDDPSDDSSDRRESAAGSVPDHG